MPETAARRSAALGDGITILSASSPTHCWADNGRGPPRLHHLLLQPRDSRIPPVGTILRRAFGGEEHDVTVCPTGFEYRSAHFKTLSAIAKHIAGTPWNGYLFFGLEKRGREPAQARDSKPGGAQ